MIRNILAAGLIGLAGLTAVAPANASGLEVRIEFGQKHSGGWGWNDDRHRTLSPQEVRRLLRDRGYRRINYVDRRGAIYQAKAVNRRGRTVGVVVSARSGAILNVYPIH